MVRHLLCSAAPQEAARQLRDPKVDREPDEWTIPELARNSQFLNRPSTAGRKGRLHSRAIAETSKPRRLVHADAAAI
jgi:hypothetical protein